MKRGGEELNFDTGIVTRGCISLVTGRQCLWSKDHKSKVMNLKRKPIYMSARTLPT